MKKHLTVLFLSVLFVVPFASHAATLDEQKTAIIVRLITLLEQQVVDLQAQLKAQETHKSGAVVTTTAQTESSTGQTTCGLVEDNRGLFHRFCSQ